MPGYGAARQFARRHERPHRARAGIRRQRLGRQLFGLPPELPQANDARTQRAQMLMQAHHAQGVPALVLTTQSGSRLLSANALYGHFDRLLSEIEVA